MVKGNDFVWFVPRLIFMCSFGLQMSESATAKMRLILITVSLFLGVPHSFPLSLNRHFSLTTVSYSPCTYVLIFSLLKDRYTKVFWLIEQSSCEFCQDQNLHKNQYFM